MDSILCQLPGETPITSPLKKTVKAKKARYIIAGFYELYKSRLVFTLSISFVKPLRL